MTNATFYVSVLVADGRDFATYKKSIFFNKNEAITFAKNYLEGTDGSAVVHILGQDDSCNWIYSKTYVAVKHKAKAL